MQYLIDSRSSKHQPNTLLFCFTSEEKLIAIPLSPVVSNVGKVTEPLTSRLPQQVTLPIGDFYKAENTDF